MEMRLTLVKPSERALCAMQINSIREYYALEAVNGFVNGFVESRSGSFRAWRGVASNKCNDRFIDAKSIIGYNAKQNAKCLTLF